MSNELRAAANEILASLDSRLVEKSTLMIAAEWLAKSYLAEHPAADDVAQFAGELFRRISYNGPDGKLLWQVAILVRQMHKLPEAFAIDAATGAQICGKQSPVGYFRTVLSERCDKAGIILSDLLKLAKISGQSTFGPPGAIDTRRRDTVPHNRHDGATSIGELLSERY